MREMCCLPKGASARQDLQFTQCRARWSRSIGVSSTRRSFPRRATPRLILLDLNMPRKDGRERLADFKNDPCLKSIPIVVLTTSDADHDVMQSYDLQASCYVTKPVDMEQFTNGVQALQEFWFCVVNFPESKLANKLVSVDQKKSGR